MKRKWKVLILTLLLTLFIGGAAEASTKGFSFLFYSGEQYTSSSDYAVKEDRKLYIKENTHTLTGTQSLMWLYGYLDGYGVCTAQTNPASAWSNKNIYYTVSVGLNENVRLNAFANGISGQVTGNFTP